MPASDQVLPPTLSCHDGLYPQTMSQRKYLLPKVASLQAFDLGDEKMNLRGRCEV